VNGDHAADANSLSRQQQPLFTLEGIAASCIPHGSSLRLCPERHFAKQGIVVSTATWLTAYEIKLKPDQIFEVDKVFFFLLF
jgi:hypothetical protein